MIGPGDAQLQGVSDRGDGKPRARRDMFSLSRARMPELIAALEDEQTLADQTSTIPRRSKQAARMLMREAIRLIRLGTRAEIADAALELAQALNRPRASQLAELHPTACRLMNSASDALSAATPPSSGGAELTVLKSGKGKGLRIVTLLNEAPGRALPRAELRVKLNDLDESHLSHLLAELEAAGLVVRVRSGRTVMVHLGLVGRSEHVQAMIPTEPRPPDVRAGTQREQVPEAGISKELGRAGIALSMPDIEEFVRAHVSLQNREELMSQQDNVLRFAGAGYRFDTGAAQWLGRADASARRQSPERSRRDQLASA